MSEKNNTDIKNMIEEEYGRKNYNTFRGKTTTDIKNMIEEMEYARDESVEASKDSLIRMDKEIFMYKMKLKHKNDRGEL
jgi:hypothetical protein